jgi:hypothetical protein
VAEEGGDGEPVGEAADHPGLGHRLDEREGVAIRSGVSGGDVGGDEDGDEGEKDAGREAPGAGEGAAGWLGEVRRRHDGLR